MSNLLDLGSEFTTALSSVAGTVSDIDFDRVASAFYNISPDGVDFSAFFASNIVRGGGGKGCLVLMILETARRR